MPTNLTFIELEEIFLIMGWIILQLWLLKVFLLWIESYKNDLVVGWIWKRVFGIFQGILIDRLLKVISTSIPTEGGLKLKIRVFL